SAAVRATSGAATRQGPHHDAQKSTRTGTFAVLRTSSNSAASASIGSATGSSGVLQAPHRTRSARFAVRIRFFWPQFLHVRIITPPDLSEGFAPRTPRRRYGEPGTRLL